MCNVTPSNITGTTEASYYIPSRSIITHWELHNTINKYIDYLNVNNNTSTDFLNFKALRATQFNIAISKMELWTEANFDSILYSENILLRVSGFS